MKEIVWKLKRWFYAGDASSFTFATAKNWEHFKEIAVSASRWEIPNAHLTHSYINYMCRYWEKRIRFVRVLYAREWLRMIVIKALAGEMPSANRK